MIKLSMIPVFFLIILLSCVAVLATNSSNLIAYYGMEGSLTNGSILPDETGHGYNLLLNGVASCYTSNASVNAQLGNSVVVGGTSNCFANNKSFKNIQNQSFSINWWWKGYRSTSQDYPFRIGNGTETSGNKMSIQPHHYGGTNTTMIRMDNGAPNGFYPDSTFLGYTEPATSGWVMVTIVYDRGNNISVYYNAVLIATNTQTNVVDGVGTNWSKVPINYFEILRTPYETYDEISVWNSSLSQDYIGTLYAAGQGLNFNQTIFLDNSSAETNTCLGQSLCNIGFFSNDTNFICTSYSLCGAPLYCQGPSALLGVSDGGASCASPYNFTVYDICMPTANIICHQATITGQVFLGQNYTVWDRSTQETCPTFINGTFNKLGCGIVCNDTFDYYTFIQANPPGMNYSAECSNGTNQCTGLGLNRCYDAQTVQTCTNSTSGFYYWKNSGTCPTNYICKIGSGIAQCLYDGSLVTNNSGQIGSASQGNDCTKALFPCNLSESQMLLTSLIVIIVTVLLVFGTFTFLGKGEKAPVMIGGALSLLLAIGELIYFTVIQYLKPYVVILMGVIGGVVLFITVRNIFLGGQSQNGGGY